MSYAAFPSRSFPKYAWPKRAWPGWEELWSSGVRRLRQSAEGIYEFIEREDRELVEIISIIVQSGILK